MAKLIKDSIVSAAVKTQFGMIEFAVIALVVIAFFSI